MRASRLVVAAVLTAGLVVVAGAQPGGFGGFGGGGLRSPDFLVQNKAVQEELKMSDEQVEKVKAWGKDFFAKRAEIMKDAGIELGKGKGGGGKGGFSPEMAEKMAEANKKITAAAYKDLEGVLKPEQVKRLKQIELQAGVPEVFQNPDVVSALKITDEQKGKLKTVIGDYQKDAREARSGLFGGGGKGGFDPEKMAEANKKVEKLRKEAVSNINDTLTAEQKAKWKEMTGETFDVSKLTPTPRKKD